MVNRLLGNLFNFGSSIFKKMNQKTVLITGATRGIGLATAKQLAAQGLFVYLGSRNIDHGNELVASLKQNGIDNCKAIPLDVTDQESILKAKGLIEQERGILDILINNAGISGVVPQSAVETPTDNYREVFEVNLYGIISTTQVFLALLKKSAEPRIVNVSTSVGSLTLQSNPDWPAYHFGKYAVYGASKAAMNMYTVHLAYELRDSKFKINAVCPGYTATDFTGQVGGSVETAAQRIIKYALIDETGPTGRFFSEESNPNGGEIPW